MAGTGTGAGGTQARGRDFAEFVRHALHATADQVEPRGDGLASIRARILAELRKRGSGKYGTGVFVARPGAGRSTGVKPGPFGPHNLPGSPA